MTLHSKHLRTLATGALALVWLSGCSTDMEKLQAEVAEIKAYESFAYNASNMRSPFVPSAPARNDIASAVRPDSKRSREFLEQFPLDTMSMVGTLQLQGKNFGLVQGKDGLVHRVLPGNFMGQNDGRVVSITPTRISIIEIVPDGLGGYIERPAALALNE